MKTLALAQHLGINYFKFQGDYYTGATQIEIDEMSITEAERFCEETATLLSDEISETSYDDSGFEYGSQEYLVYTDDEAEEAWSESIDQYIDDCVLSELPEQYRQYFDNEKFKGDCKHDGRGHTLAGYDGHEQQEIVSTSEGYKIYYIYRTN